MRISKFRLMNYMSYYDQEPEDVVLGPGINFIVGRNSSGKTKLLDMLTLDARGRRTVNLHPPLPAKSKFTESDLGSSRYDIEISFDNYEIVSMLQSETDIIFLPEFGELAPDGKMPPQDVARRLLFESQRLRFRYSHDLPNYVEFVGSEYVVPFHVETLPFRSLAISSNPDPTNLTISDQLEWTTVPDHESCWHVLYNQAIPQRIHRIDANRNTPSNSTAHDGGPLMSDGSDFVSDLVDFKHSDRLGYWEFLSRVRQVLPAIRDLTFESSDGTLELRVSENISGQYDYNLDVPLSDCGSGVNHVLRIVFLVVSNRQPSIMLIDEPQSFLHPGAIRNLLRVLEEYNHHQYILTTHSPTAIMSVKEKRILLVERDGTVSRVRSVNVDEDSDLEDMLREIGSSRSDIFGMDAYIWVEGKTDKTCFDLIMGHHGGLPAGIEIVDLVHTGDFSDKKRGALIEQIYARLSGSVGILPSVLAFVFDGDLQSDDFKQTDTRMFLPRQNYESYLIAPDILADILNRDAADGKPKDHTADSVTQWIRVKEGKEYDDPQWLKSVDGAKLLNTMFQDLAGISYNGNKAQYGEEITRHILAADPNHFQEIVCLIKSILPAAAA